MDSAFLKILNMGLSASWLVLAVLLLRLALRRAPKWTRCLLWAVVAARLLCPFSLESALSLVPSAEPLPEATLYDAHPRLETGVPILNEAAAPMMERAFAPQLGDSVNPLQVWIHVGALVWLAGAAAMMLYAAVSTAGLRRRVAASVERDGAYICDGIESPFILGVLRPRIYLPSGLTEPALSHVFAHERAHLARRDHLWKPLGFALLTVYWFNPLLWPAYILLCRDIELACDERVYRDMPLAARADYSQALLEQSRGRRVAACPLAFGETDVRTRVKAALRYKKPAVWLAVLAVAVCAAAAACFLTDPQRLALDFPREALTGAEVRHAETAEVRSLTDEELDGLYRRLEDLGGARRGSFEGTPLYTLTATVSGEGELQIRGYVSDGSATELRYKNKSWRISGGDLAQYVLALCLNVPETTSAASWSADLDGAETVELKITAQFDGPSGIRPVGQLTVSLDEAFAEPLKAAQLDRSGSTATYSVTIPSGTKTLYVKPIVSRLTETFDRPVEALIGDDETGVVMLDGAEWLTISTGSNPQSGLHCLVLRTVPGSAYISGADFSLMKPDAVTATAAANVYQYEPSVDALDSESAVAYLRFAAMDEPGAFAGCTLTVGAGRTASTLYQPELTCDGVELVFVEGK